MNVKEAKLASLVANEGGKLSLSCSSSLFHNVKVNNECFVQEDQEILIIRAFGLRKKVRYL